MKKKRRKKAVWSINQLMNEMKVGVFYYSQGLNGNFTDSELRQSFAPRVVQSRNLSVHTGCGYQTSSPKRLVPRRAHVAWECPCQQPWLVIKSNPTKSPNPEQFQTHKKKKLKQIIKTFLLLLHRRRMNTPATQNSPSMTNARLSDHRRHVFHEKPSPWNLHSLSLEEKKTVHTKLPIKISFFYFFFF